MEINADAVLIPVESDRWTGEKVHVSDASSEICCSDVLRLKGTAIGGANRNFSNSTAPNRVPLYAGAITTLGRGGSDLTATLIGAALQVPEVQVWKDVDGAPIHFLKSLSS